MTARERKYMLNIKLKGYTWQLAFPVYFDYNRKEVPVKLFEDFVFETEFDPKNNTQKCVDWMNEHWKDDGPFVFIEDEIIGQVQTISGTTIASKIGRDILNQRTDAERSVATNAQ